MVSVRRLEDLLIAEERELEANPPTDPSKPAIMVHDTDFAWDPKVPIFCLEESSWYRLIEEPGPFGSA